MASIFANKQLETEKMEAEKMYNELKKDASHTNLERKDEPVDN